MIHNHQGPNRWHEFYWIRLGYLLFVTPIHGRKIHENLTGSGDLLGLVIGGVVGAGKFADVDVLVPRILSRLSLTRNDWFQNLYLSNMNSMCLSVFWVYELLKIAIIRHKYTYRYTQRPQLVTWPRVLWFLHGLLYLKPSALQDSSTLRRWVWAMVKGMGLKGSAVLEMMSS